MTSNTSASKNPEMMQLMKKITKTVYQMRSVEVMGDMYERLVRLLNVGKETKLIDYKPHRFMGLAKVMQRIVKHWEVLVLWYNERATKAERERTAPPNPFPLAEDKLLMEQLVSLMQPIVVLDEKSQADKANQVDVLLSTYKVMVTTLAAEQPLKKYDATRDNPTSYHHSTLVPLITKTRALLSAAFHSRFFSRYTDREKMRTCSYVWEMQMLLHPHVKNPDGPLSGMIKACGELVHLDQHIIERIQSVIKTTVKSKLLALMRELDPPVGRDNLERREPSSSYGAGVFSEDLSELFDIRSTAPDLTPPELVHEERINEELERWFRDPELLQRSNDDVFESVLHFWKRQHEYGTYQFLPRVARVVFAVPVSSAQIERDFGISGQMVITQRTSLSAQNIYMCAFLNRN